MIASQFGLKVAREVAAAAAADSPDVAKELEGLFGPEAGPAVRTALEKLIDKRAQDLVAPLRSSLGHVLNQGEAARMKVEEERFRARHRRDLTPEIEAEVVRLGESGEFVPGETQTPAQYLDALYDVVRARKGRRTASEDLARRIARNAGDREPSGQSARAGVRKVSGVQPTMSIAEALDAADRELREEEGA